MEQTLIIIGAICIVAAIAGGGVKLAGNELPVIHSWLRQALLAAFGAVLIGIGWWYPAPQASQLPSSGQAGVTVAKTVTTPAPTAQNPTSAPSSPEPWKCGKPNAIIRRKIAPGDLTTDSKGQRYVDLGGIEGSGDTTLTGVVESATLKVQFGYVHLAGSERQFQLVNSGSAKTGIAFKFNVALADAGVAFPDGLASKITVNICRQAP